MISRAKAIKQVRDLINGTSRLLLSESIRKQLVVRYYQFKAQVFNKGRAAPKRTADELLSWRQTLEARIEYSVERYRGNVFYGAGRNLRHYCAADNPICACIEHGLYLGDYVNESELDASCLPALLVPGPVRHEIVRAKSNVPLIEIGPQIAYAESYLDSNEMALAKKNIGKTLLVFPCHVIEFMESRIDAQALIKELLCLKQELDIDTVLVCLYYRDIINGVAIPFEESGFTVVTSGWREDSNFLSRLRTLIDLSDCTASDGVGTHLGYCIYRNRPHFLIGDAFPREGCEALEREQIREISSAFVDVNLSVTSEQIRICEQYWGLSKVRTPDQIKRIFDLSAKAMLCSSSRRQDELRALIKYDEGRMVSTRSLIDGGFNG